MSAAAIAQPLVQGLAGFSNGLQAALAEKKEKEIIQGKNYYLGVFPRVVQMMTFGNVAQTLATSILGKAVPWPVSLACNIAPFAYIPIGLATAAVKQDHYSHFQPALSKILPKKLPKLVLLTANFLAQHTGTIIRVALLVSAVALLAFGQYAFGGALLAVLLYREIDALGFVPRKISLFVETHIAKVINIGILLGGGTFIAQAFAIYGLISDIPPIQRFVTHKADALLRKIFPTKSPSLAEYQAPLLEKKNMTASEIHKILDAQDKHIEINPAHCSKLAVDLSKLPKDKQFAKLRTLLSAIDLEKSSALIRKLQDDEVFNDHLKSKFPEFVDVRQQPDADIEELAKKKGMKRSDYLDHWLKSEHEPLIDKLASEKGITKGKYVADWTKASMNTFVDVLLDKRQVKGQQSDLAVCLDNMEAVLPYIEKLPASIEKEDLIFKVAIEGGDYCARGIRAVSDEILNETVIPNHFNQEEIIKSNPVQSYEMKIRQILQNHRFGLVQEQYSEIRKVLNVPDAVGADRHGFDTYRQMLSCGFYPLTAAEQREEGLLSTTFWNWSTYRAARDRMLNTYENIILNTVPKKPGEPKPKKHPVFSDLTQFNGYIQTTIGSNPNLSAKEKEEITEKFTERNGDLWSVEETNKRFQRLALASLGVLRVRPHV